MVYWGCPGGVEMASSFKCLLSPFGAVGVWGCGDVVTHSVIIDRAVHTQPHVWSCDWQR